MPRPNQGAVGFQGPIGVSGVIDQSPEDGFPQPPTVNTHPAALNLSQPAAPNSMPAGRIAPVSAYTTNLPDLGPAPAISGPLTPWNQEGITPPKGTAPTNPQFGVSQEQVLAMQAAQRAMKIVQVAPSLKTHPDIVAALAYNNSIPFNDETIKLIAAVQRARSAINYSANFTMDDYNQTAHLVNPQAFAHEGFWNRIGRGLGMELNWLNKEAFEPVARGAMRGISNLFGGQTVNYAPTPGGGAELPPILAGSTGVKPAVDELSKIASGIQTAGEAFTKPSDVPVAPGANLPSGGESGGLVAAAPPILPAAKPIINFVTDQFDTPEHLYRYIATVQHKYGNGMAALALIPTIAGAGVGAALGGLGGAKGAELATAAEEALTNSFINEGLSDLAAATLAKRDLSLLEERASVLTAQRAQRVGNVAGQLGRVITAPVNLAAKVATSPISLGADVGFTGGGQMLFRQDYMDSRDGTEWAKKYPMLASTFGRFATQNMDPGGFKTFLSGALDAIAAVAVPDAIGSAGRVAGIARSAEGFTGGLLSGKYKDTGNWFGNIYDKYGGISRSAEGGLKIGGIYKTGLRLSNIDAAYNESVSARRTVNLIAQMGSAGAIMAIDARFAPISDLLAKARVLNADGTVNMTKSVENVKQVLRDSQTAAELMERPLAMSSLPLTASGIYRDMGEALSKANALTGHMFSPMPLYASQKTLRMENRVFTIGDRDALPAIRDMIGVQYGYGVADQIVNELASNLDPHFWQQTIVNGLAGEMAASVAKSLNKIKLPEPIANAILKEYDKIIPEKLRQVFNFGGPNQQGAYGWAVHVDEKGVASQVNMSRIKERVEKAPEPSSTASSSLFDISNYDPVAANKSYEFLVKEADQTIAKSKVANVETPLNRGLQKGVFARLRREFGNGKFPNLDVNQFENILGQIKDLADHVGINLFDDVRLETASFAYADPLKPEGAWGQGKSIPGVAGMYNSEEKMISLFADALLDPEQFLETGIHELWHHLENFVPLDEQIKYTQEMTRARAKFLRKYPIKDFLASDAGKNLKQSSPARYAELEKFAGENAKTILTQPGKFPWEKQLEYTLHQGKDIGYRLTKSQEWFAESMKDFTLREQNVGGPVAQIARKFMSMLTRAWGRVFGKAESERLFQKFWTGQYRNSKIDEITENVGNFRDVSSGSKTPSTPTGVPEELFGGNHSLNDVLNPKTQETISSAIVPEELGKMHLPSYIEIERVQKQFVDMMKKRYEEAINVAPDIQKLNDHIGKLKTKLAGVSDPDELDKINKQIDKANALLAIKKEIGASVPEKTPNFGYGVFKKGLSGASSLYDAIDHYYNNMFFKRAALATGGWAMRTGMSEAALNIMRQGPLNYTAGRLAASVARHERAVLHIGKKFTRQAAEDIAARIYYVVKEDGMLGPNGAAFKTNAEMEAAVANVRRVANEANYYFKISNEQIAKALRKEEKDANRFFTANKTAAAYRGFMVGAKSQILKQLNKQDLLDAAIRLMYLNDGHIVSPMLNATHAGIANDIQIGSGTEDNVNMATWKNPFIASNEKLQKAKFAKDFQTIEPGVSRFPQALHTRSEWMLGSKIYAPTFAAYNEEYSKAKQLLLDAGMGEKEASSKAANIAAEQIRPQVQHFLDTKMSAGEKKAMLRTSHPLPENISLYAAKLDPRYADLSDEELAAIDHVTAVIKSAEGHVRFNDGTINESLLHAMAHNEIPADLGDFKKQMMSSGGKPIDLGMFNNTVGPELDYAPYNALEKAFRIASVGKLPDVMHKKILGPIVNRLTRDPVYIIDFAAERKLLDSKVAIGEMTKDEADTIAQARASVNAMRYVHNPKNKLKFENMMRLWAPFYFAENQAWRRLGRLAWTNPGAAEQYVKAMYGAQQVAYQYDQKNNKLSIPIPGSAWMNKHWFTGVGMPLELSPNSLRTVFPWSAEGGQAPGVGSLIDSFMPKAGPVLSIPGNVYLQKFAGFAPALDEVLSKYVVGQAGLGQPAILSLFPNSIIANVAKGIIGAATAGDKGSLNQSLLGTSASSYIAANIMVQTALLDDLQEKAWNRHKDDAVPDVWKTYGITQHEYAMFGMMNDIEEQFHDPDARQKFLDTANFKTMEMWTAKTLVGATSPMSTLIGRANLQYSQEFQAEIKKTGSVLMAANNLLKKHPYITAETLFTTVSTNETALGVAWPTTPGTSEFMLKNKAIINKYPAAMRFALEEGPQLKGKNGYDQLAHFIQTSWGLRAQRSPRGFLNAYLGAVFNQFHYGVLQPMAQELKKRGYSSTEINNALLHNSVTWKSRENDPSKWSILEQFGKEVAPLAFNQYLTGQSEINRAAAFQQLREVVAMPEMVAKYPNFKAIHDELLPSADALIKAKEQSVGNPTYRDELAVSWNKYLDGQAASNPNLLPVIQQLFRPLAPIFTN